MSETIKRNPNKDEWNNIYALRALPENQKLSVEQFWPIVEKYINGFNPCSNGLSS